MRNKLLSLIAVILGLGLAHPGATRELPKPKLLAVYFYADWCPNCKILSPQLEKARADGNFDNQNILFVTMDLTGKPTIHQSILRAQALGIGEFLQAQGSATGYVAVLDAESKKELARYDSASSSADIENGLKSLLK